jgi:hypothetical protein
MKKKAIKTIDRSTLAEILSTYEVVSAFLGWLEDQGHAELKDKYGDLLDLDNLAKEYATDNEAERAALRDILERYK